MSEVYECIKPNKNIQISLTKINDPLKAFREAYNIAAKVLEIKRSKYWEKEFRYDTTDGSFFARIEMEQGKMELDPYASRKFVITMRGKQPLKKGESGNITITINATLTINFPSRKGIASTPLFTFFFNFNHVHFTTIFEFKFCEGTIDVTGNRLYWCDR